MGTKTRAALLVMALTLVAVPSAAPAATPRFVRGLSIALPGPPGTLVAAELSGDRHTDVVVAAGDLIELRNTGDGGLRRHRLLALPKNAYLRDRGYQYVVAGDLNGDGRDDLVAFAEVKTPKRVVGTAPDGKPIYLESGWAARTLLGTPAGPRPGALLTLPIYVNSPTLTDLDGDGRVDLVFTAIPDARFANGGDSALFVARGRGDGSFEAPRPLLDPVRIGDPSSGSGVIVAGDFDRDGSVDLAIGGVDGVQVLPAIGTATPRAAVTSPTCGSAQLVAGDLDGDGATDFAASCYYEDQARVLLADPALGPFGFRETQRRRAGIRPFAPALADVDGDDRLDVLVPALAADEHSGFISVLRNRGAGRLAPAFHVPVNQAIAVIAADLNGDRRRDIIAADVGRNLVVTAFNDPRRLPATTRHAPRGARISIHTTRAHVAPRERDASFVLRCSRGRGQCRGRLEVRGTGHLRGRLLGRQRFELQPGRHRAVLVGISDDGFSVRRVRVAAFSTYNSARRNAVLTGPTRAERRVACSPKDSRTLATGPRMRVYELKRFPGDATACLPTVGHPVGLGLGYETQGPFAIDGERVAYGAQECGDPAFPCTLDVVVVDVRSGRFLHTAPADGPPANDAGAVSSIVLRSDGVAAWIACFGVVRAQNRCRARGPRSVVTFAGKDRSRRLARGRIRSGSLRLSPSGRRVSWLEGSRRRSAKLEP